MWEEPAQERDPALNKTCFGQKPHARQFLAIAGLFLVIVLATTNAGLSSIVSRAKEEYYHKDFKWSYKNYDWTWSLDIPKSIYQTYKQVPVSTRTRDGPAGYDYLTTTNDDSLQLVAAKLKEAATQESYDSYETVSFVLAFVQSLTYTSDSVTSGYDEYPRFPMETLVDDGGDCEDTAILFATLTVIMNYDTVFISPPEHLAAGVWGGNLIGSYYTYNGRNYFFCETTGDGFGIGDIPDDYRGAEAYIYEIDQSRQFNPSSNVNSSTGTGSSGFDMSSYAGVALPLLIAGVLIAHFVSNRNNKNQPQVASIMKKPVAVESGNSALNKSSKFCRYCGSGNEMYASFCEKCGKNIE